MGQGAHVDGPQRDAIGEAVRQGVQRVGQHRLRATELMRSRESGGEGSELKIVCCARARPRAKDERTCAAAALARKRARLAPRPAQVTTRDRRCDSSTSFRRSSTLRRSSSSLTGALWMDAAAAAWWCWWWLWWCPPSFLSRPGQRRLRKANGLWSWSWRWRPPPPWWRSWRAGVGRTSGSRRAHVPLGRAAAAAAKETRGGVPLPLLGKWWAASRRQRGGNGVGRTSTPHGPRFIIVVVELLLGKGG